MERWNGRVALVTGASSGIGAAVSRALVQAGMKVVGAARRVDRIKKLADELKNEKGSMTAIACDLSKDEDVYSLFKSIKEIHGGVDVCVNNAAFSYEKTLIDGSPEQWRNMMNVNVIAPCLCTKLTLESLRERGLDDGHIISISSYLGHVSSSQFSIGNFYSTTKHALRSLSEGFRFELREAKSHTRVSSISPGYVQTEFLYNMVGDRDYVDNYYKSMKCFTADDIKDTLMHILAVPPHVEINDVIMRPTEQQH